MKVLRNPKVIWVVAIGVLLGLFYLGRKETEAPAEFSPPKRVAKLEGLSQHLVVDFHDDVDAQAIEAVARKYGLELKPNSLFSKSSKLFRSKKTRRNLRRLIAQLTAEQAVEYAEPEWTYSIPDGERAIRINGTDGSATDANDTQSVQPAKKGRPNDPKYQYQWHLHQLGTENAWGSAVGRDIVVAVIDTGVAYKDKEGKFKAVPDLEKTKFVKGYDFVNDDDEPLDDHGHGTHVAGTIAQSTNNGIGVAGVAWAASIMPLKVLSAGGYGSVTDIAEAVRFAADNGAHIINMSLGGPRAARVLKSAVEYAHKKGVLVICAAGNDGRGRVSYPAAYPYAVAVAATQFDRTTTFYSNWGKAIDVAAPGGNTRVDQNGDGMPDGVLQNTIEIGNPLKNDYLMFMGTSMAAPHVAGVAALIMGSGVSKPEAVLNVLTETAQHPKNVDRDDHYGAGIINAEAALGKSKGRFGGYRLAVAIVLLLLVMGGIGGGSSLRTRDAPGSLAGLVIGACGLFMLPFLGKFAGGVFANGLPGWGNALAGQGLTASLWQSALPLIGIVLLLFGVRKLRGVLFGLSLGFAANLIFLAAFPVRDLAWIPNFLAIEPVWLLVNAGICIAIAVLIAKRRRPA